MNPWTLSSQPLLPLHPRLQVKVFQTSVVSPPAPTSHQQQTQRRVPSTAGGDVPRVYSPGQPQQVAYGPAGRGGVNVANLPSGPRVVQPPSGGPPQLRRGDSRSGLLPGQSLPAQYQQQQQQYHQQQVFQQQPQQQQRNYPPQQGITNKPPLQIIQPRQLINSQGNTQDNSLVNGPLRAYDPKTQPGQQIRPLNQTGQIVQNRLLQRNPQQLSQQPFVTSGGSEDVVPELLNGGMGTEGSKLQGNKNRSYSVAGPINNNLSKIITEEERRRSIAVISRSDGQQQVQQKPRLFSIIKGRLHTLDGKPGLIQHQQPYSSLQSPPQNSSTVGELIRKMEQAPETDNVQQGTNGVVVSGIKPSVVPPAPVKPSSATGSSSVGSSSITQGSVGGTVSTSPTPKGLDVRNLALERNAPSTIMENKYSDPKHSEGVLPSKLEDDKETSSSRYNVKEEDRPLSRVGGAPFHGISSPAPTSFPSKDIETKHADSKLSNVQNDKTPEPLNAEPVPCFKPVSGFNEEIPQDSKPKSEIKSTATTHDKNTSEMNFTKTSEGTKNNETVERLLNGHIDDVTVGTPPDKDNSSDSKTASTSSLREVVKVQGHPDDVSPATVAIEPLVNGNINGEESVLELLDKEKLGNISTTHVEDKSPTPFKQESVHGDMGSTISPSLENIVKKERATNSKESKKEIDEFEKSGSKSEHLASSSSISNNLETSSPIPEFITSSSSNDNEDHILTLPSNKSFDAHDEISTKSPSPIPYHLEGRVESDQKSKASSPKSSPASSPLPSSPKPEEKVEVKAKGLESLSRPATPVSKSENAPTSMPSATPAPDKLPETPVKSKLAAESKPVVFESSFSESLHFEAKSSDKLETPESLPEPIKESKVSLDDKIISQTFIKSASGALSQNVAPEKEDSKKIKSDSLKQLSHPSSPKAHSKEEVGSSPESVKEKKMDTSRPVTPKYISPDVNGEEILTTGHKTPTLEKNKSSANKEICIETNQVDINSQNGILSPKSSSAKSNKDTNKSAKERSALSGKTKDDQDKFKRPVAKKQSREPSICDTKKDGDHDSGVDESTQGHEPTTNGDVGSPQKSPSKIPAAKRGAGSSPTKTPVKSPVKSSAASSKSSTAKAPVETPPQLEKKKVPMNKVQVGAAPSPNLKTIRSKIGSLDNTSYKPGGGKVKIEHRKLDFSKTQPKIAAKNDAYVSKGGDKKITQVKLQWNAKPKVGSLDNATHKPGGGDKKIETVKLDFKDKAKPKVGSKDNVKHSPGGGAIKIESQKLEIKAESKVGSLSNVKHKPGGGEKKIFDDKTYLKQISSGSSEGRASGIQTPEPISPSHSHHSSQLIAEESQQQS